MALVSTDHDTDGLYVFVYHNAIVGREKAGRRKAVWQRKGLSCQCDVQYSVERIDAKVVMVDTACKQVPTLSENLTQYGSTDMVWDCDL